MDSLNRSISCHVRTTFQILFKSSICFACTATKSERMNGCGLSLVFPLCITLSGSELLSNRLYKLGGFCLAFRWNGHEKLCSYSCRRRYCINLRWKIDVTQFANGMECYPCHNFDELFDDRPLTEYIKTNCGQSFTNFAIKNIIFGIPCWTAASRHLLQQKQNISFVIQMNAS